MAPKHGPGQAVEGAVEETAVHRAVGAVVFARAVGVEEANDDDSGPELRGRVTDLHLVDPLGHGVVVELLDFVLVHDGLDHQVRPVAIDLGGREMDELEPVGDLQADDVLRAHGVGAPESLVEVLTVPASELGRAVVDVVEGPQRSKTRSICRNSPMSTRA